MLEVETNQGQVMMPQPKQNIDYDYTTVKEIRPNQLWKPVEQKGKLGYWQ